jgi:hypothetical protein
MSTGAPDATARRLGPRLALVCLTLATVAAVVFALVTVRYGWVWLAPMVVSLMIALGPATVLLLRYRFVLLRMLQDLPVRRYRSPRRIEEPLSVTGVECDFGRVTDFRTIPLRMLGSCSDRLALFRGAVLGRGTLRLRYRDVPFAPSLPAVFAWSGRRGVALAWQGPDRLLQVDVERPPGAAPGGLEEAAAAALEWGARADERRGRDLEILGELSPCPVEAVMDVVLEAGYSRQPSVALACVSDYLTLCELEFAGPADSSFTTQRVEVNDPLRGQGFEGLHAEGQRPGQSLDLVLVREGLTSVAVFLRRSSDDSAGAGAPEA